VTVHCLSLPKRARVNKVIHIKEKLLTINVNNSVQ